MKALIQKSTNLISSFIDDSQSSYEYFDVIELSEDLDASIIEEIVASRGKSYLAESVPDAESMHYRPDQLFFKYITESKTLEKIEISDIFKSKLSLSEEIKRIDRSTTQAISEGFEFDGSRFSLSQNAQLNWYGLLLLDQTGLFEDQDISTADDKVYRLTQKKLKPFVRSAHRAIHKRLESGRNKKQQVS